MTIRMRALLAALLVVFSGPLLAQAAGIGFSPAYRFLKAVRDRDGDAATEMTATPGSTVINSRDMGGSGDGALHMLVRGRDLNWLNFMLSRGARADLQNSDGATALLLAAQIGWREGAERLLAARANTNIPNNQGETPLIFAVRRFDAPMVRLLMSRGADPNQTDSLSGNSALDYARQDRRGQALIPILEQRRAAPDRPVQGPPAPPRQP